ncbi:hypothetical protein ACI2KR_31975 [Pseudomonas luteola]
MSREIQWAAETSVRSKSKSGLESALENIESLPQGHKQAYISELVLIAMVGGWTEGVDRLLKTPGIAFPTESVRDGLHYYSAPYNQEIGAKLLQVLSYHQKSIAPSLKAEIGFEFGAYMPQHDWDRFRASGLIDAKDNTKSSFRLHGASERQGAEFPERIAQLIAEMPLETKTEIYNRSFTSQNGRDKETHVYQVSFMKELIQDDVLFDSSKVDGRLFKIAHDHLSDPEYASKLIDRGQLGPDNCVTALWKNPENAQIAEQVAEKIADLGKSYNYDSDFSIKTRIIKNKEILDLLKTNRVNSDNNDVKQNALLVCRQLVKNIEDLEGKMPKPTGLAM